jgi:hypothetical protein
MLKVAHDGAGRDAASGSAVSSSQLDAIVRDGARQLLAAALAAEVAAYIEAHCGEVDVHGHRLVVRNGYHAEREVTTAAGAVTVRAPRVNDKRIDEATGQRCRVFFGDPARLGTEVATGGGAVAAAVPAWPVHQRPPPRRWSSSWAPATGCRRPRSPG